MSIALGVHVGVEEVSAVLVEADLPELGPVSTRAVSVAAAPGGVGDAVTTMLGIMRVQAAQNDLHIVGSAVVCDSIALCGIVRAALAAHDVRGVGVVDVGDPRLDAEVPWGIAAALFGTANSPAASIGETVGDGFAVGEGGGRRFEGDASDTPRSARLTMIGLGVAILGALSGATVWALAAAGPAQNGVVETIDVAERPSSGDGATGSSPVVVVADSAGAVSSPSAVPPVAAALLEVPVYGPAPVVTWSEVLPTGPVITPTGGALTTGGNSSGGRQGGVTGGGSSAGDGSDGDSDAGETSTVDPIPEPEPETPTTDPEPTTEVPVTTDPATPDPTSTDPTTTDPTTNTEPAESPVE
ncbi:hypothetical protein CH275_05675 [Rhodococcus sp. 06-235-1A]|uniref:hypothetical protein n=1 Tax=Rhodococcus sp. 06-235-1A TaxID=2022508 RepID=UPI000B9B4930|nr:hypothetical protein [Rhodococcus sp. 06-235-1A]OZD08052.1 hypothetical protein CH275_05675 [Rhodococcus sp. 06-235-1A]